MTDVPKTWPSCLADESGTYALTFHHVSGAEQVQGAR
jgi:hypothetical protein